MPARDPLPPPPEHDDDPPRSRNLVWLIVAAGAAFTLLVLVLSVLYPGTLADRFNQQGAVYYGIWATVLGAALIVHWRGRFGQALWYILVWVAIGAALIVGYLVFGDRLAG